MHGIPGRDEVPGDPDPVPTAGDGLPGCPDTLSGHKHAVSAGGDALHDCRRTYALSSGGEAVPRHKDPLSRRGHTMQCRCGKRCHAVPGRSHPVPFGAHKVSG
jgi:hypothetical protein